MHVSRRQHFIYFAVGPSKRYQIDRDDRRRGAHLAGAGALHRRRALRVRDQRVLLRATGGATVPVHGARGALLPPRGHLPPGPETREFSLRLARYFQFLLCYAILLI